MVQRLSPLDVSFLYMEEPTTPMHVGGLAIFQIPATGLVYEKVVDLISERISLVPRYRQKLKWVPGRLSNPVWIDDNDFDITYHVRRSALPKPGKDDQLRDFVARIQSRPLDRSRPLWELYVVEGLSKNRAAVVTKIHHAMVDGISAIDIGAIILDPTPEPRATAPDTWIPNPEPSALALIAEVFSEVVRSPGTVIDSARGGFSDVRATAGRLGKALSGVLSITRSAVRSAPESPLNATIGEQRRFGMLATSLDDYKLIRKSHGGTINDVVLATVAGGLREWLLTRGESVNPSSTVRVMVPVSVRSSDDGGALGNRVSSYFVDLPVGEQSPVMRLHQVSYEMAAHKESNAAVGADALVGMTGFAPPTLHAMGARVASSLTRRMFNTVVTNVPGPQLPLYAAGAQLLAIYPVVPLAKGQAVSIGVTSYNGGVYFGLNADRDSMPDVDVLAQCIGDSLAALVATVS